MKKHGSFFRFQVSIASRLIIASHFFLGIFHAILWRFCFNWNEETFLDSVSVRPSGKKSNERRGKAKKMPKCISIIWVQRLNHDRAEEIRKRNF